MDEAREEAREVLVALLEEAAEHREVQRLAEAAGPGQEEDLAPGASSSSRMRCDLVDVGEPLLAQLAEVVDADRGCAGSWEPGTVFPAWLSGKRARVGDRLVGQPERQHVGCLLPTRARRGIIEEEEATSCARSCSSGASSCRSR